MNSRVDVLEVIQCLASSLIASKPQAICCRLLNQTGFNQISLSVDPKVLVNLIIPEIKNAIAHAKHAITIKLCADENKLSLAFLYDDQQFELTSCQLPESAVLTQKLPELIGKPIKVRVQSQDKLLKHCFRSFEQHMNIECLTDENTNKDLQSPCDIEIEDFRADAKNNEDSSLNHSHPKVILRSILNLKGESSDQHRDIYWPFFDSDLHTILGEIKQLRKPKVLVADDSKPSKMATMVMLEHLGCIVTGADDGISALELATQQPFDLIFLDERMPGLFGSDVAQQLRDDKNQNQLTPKISLTGITDKNSVDILYDKGITHHIVKPVTKLVLENFLVQWRNK